MRKAKNDWRHENRENLPRTKTGNLKNPSPLVYTKWFLDAWHSLKPKIIIDSFYDVSGFMLPVNRSEDYQMLFNQAGRIKNSLGKVIPPSEFEVNTSFDDDAISIEL